MSDIHIHSILPHKGVEKVKQKNCILMMVRKKAETFVYYKKNICQFIEERLE